MPKLVRCLAFRVGACLLCTTLSWLSTQAQSLPPETYPLTPIERKVYSLVSEAIEETTIAQFPNVDMPNLPLETFWQVGANGVIVLDSARADRSQGWICSAYAIIQLTDAAARLPLVSHTIALGGRPSTPNRLTLVADQTLTLEGQGKLHLAADGRSYLELACDGVKTLHLEGTLTMEDSLIEQAEVPSLPYPVVVDHPAQLRTLAREAQAAHQAAEHSPAKALGPGWIIPNPSDGHFQLRAPGLHPLLLQVYDPLGREVMRQQWEPREAARQTFQLPSSAPAGCYLVRLRSQEGIHTIKLLLRR